MDEQMPDEWAEADGVPIPHEPSGAELRCRPAVVSPDPALRAARIAEGRASAERTLEAIYASLRSARPQRWV